MSSQRGNIQKARGPKHQNKTAFRNNLHDTSLKTKQINKVVATGLCQRCKDTIDWKIKYKKYKPLTQPRTCNKCHEKTVKQAYYTICIPCAHDSQICQKCGQKGEAVLKPSLSAAEQASKDTMLQFELQNLTERQRRTFFRSQESGKRSGLSDPSYSLDVSCEQAEFLYGSEGDSSEDGNEDVNEVADRGDNQTSVLSDDDNSGHAQNKL